MGNKYKAKSSTYNGYTYHSKAEAKYAWELDCRVKAKDIKSWERQKRISLEAYGKHICYYYVDFVIVHNDKTLEYIEVKGFMTNIGLMKIKMMKAKIEKEEPKNKYTIVRV